MRQEEHGGLRVHIAGGTDRQGGGDGPIVVLLHGFGAPGDDLVPLWRVLDVPAATRFVFPEAPLALASGWGEARAWWMIDLARMERAQRNPDAVAALAEELPPELPAARAHVIAMLDGVCASIGDGPLVLGGFSQGAILACDVALADPRPLAGLALMSAALIMRTTWEARAASRAGLPVVQSHGALDPLLPQASAEALRDLLSAAGLRVEWVPFGGGHAIPDAALERLGALVTRVARGDE